MPLAKKISLSRNQELSNLNQNFEYLVREGTSPNSVAVKRGE